MPPIKHWALWPPEPMGWTRSSQAAKQPDAAAARNSRCRAISVVLQAPGSSAARRDDVTQRAGRPSPRLRHGREAESRGPAHLTGQKTENNGRVDGVGRAARERGPEANVPRVAVPTRYGRRLRKLRPPHTQQSHATSKFSRHMLF